MSKWRLEKEFNFEAAHQLPHHDGKCARLHGHSWRGKISFQGEELTATGPKSGMLVDYSVIKALVNPLVEAHLDHYFLNETTGLENPTSEEIARWVCEKITDKLGESNLLVYYVQIDETCTSSCRYYPHAI